MKIKSFRMPITGKTVLMLLNLLHSDNWNNFWLIIVSGTYLRHSGDTAFVRTLYPYIQKSLKQALNDKR